MMTAEEKLTAEDIRYLKVAIGLALGSADILDMPKTKDALNELYHKIERRRIQNEGLRDRQN